MMHVNVTVGVDDLKGLGLVRRMVNKLPVTIAGVQYDTAELRFLGFSGSRTPEGRYVGTIELARGRNLDGERIDFAAIPGLGAEAPPSKFAETVTEVVNEAGLIGSNTNRPDVETNLETEEPD